MQFWLPTKVLMRIAALVLALAASLSLPASAQGYAQTRQGFWISFGFGAGSLRCNDCDNADGDEDRLNGVNFNFRAGGTLSQKLLIGGEYHQLRVMIPDSRFTG